MMQGVRRVNVGVIGGGGIAEAAHLPAYQSAFGVRIVGVADPDAERLELLSKKFLIKNTFRDYHDLLKIDELDVVSVCVPTFLHHEVVLEAAERHKHILCEKPLALNVKQAEDMVTAARRHDVQLYVGFDARFRRAAKETMAFLEKGFLEKPFSLNIKMSTTPPPPGSWYLNKEMGGGALFDMGVHAVDLLLHNFGECKVSSASFERAINGSADIAAKINLDMTKQVEALIEVDWRSPAGTDIMLNVNGTNGRLSADLMRSKLSVKKQNIILGKQIDKFTMCLEERVESHCAEIWEFIEAARKNEPSKLLANGEDGLKALQVLEEAYAMFKN